MLCDDARIREMNKEWRGKDSATDVLLFPEDQPAGAPLMLLGDLVISVDTAARQAEERRHSLVDELRILLVHGLLHVLDYDQEAGAELPEVEVVKVAKAKTPSAEADEAGAVANDVDVFVVWDAEMVGADARVPDEEAVGDLAAVREG
jgi:rRNA maturation RNase YbeY